MHISGISIAYFEQVNVGWDKIYRFTLIRGTL